MINWKKGRGKLGIFKPLLDKTWVAESETEMGSVRCTRRFERVLGGKYVKLHAVWHFVGGGQKDYEEIAFYGVDSDKNVHFWSFTNDGKHAEGWLADASDIDERAFGFEADMPAGRGRMAYWPDEKEGFRWTVGNKTKKGWNYFLEHHYRQA